MRWVVLGVVLLLAGLYLLAAVRGPDAVGVWQDDAVYLVTAKSLAEGHGYRHLEIPGRPYQTKYPILFPAVLAGLMRLWPEYPRNMPLLLAPGALAGAAFVGLSALYLVRVLGVSRRRAAAVGVLAALSPEILSLARFTMSDLPYAALSVAALLCLDYKYESAASPGRRRMWLTAAGLVIAAGMLTRSFGVTLAAAAVANLLRKRRFLDAALLAGIVALAMAPWWAWRLWAERANGALQAFPMNVYDLSYTSWLPRGVGEAARTAWQNFFRVIFGIGYFQFSSPDPWTTDAVREFSWKTVFLHGAFYLAAALVVIGFASSARRGWRTLHVYAVFYLVAMLFWPFEPYRFLACWTPFLLYFLPAGMEAAVRWLSGLAADRPSRPGRILAGLVCLALAVGFIVEDRNILTGTRKHFRMTRVWINLSGVDDVCRWVRENTLPGDVLAWTHTADVFLATGRQVRDIWPLSNPQTIFYGRGRTWWSFFQMGDIAEMQWLYQQINTHLEDYYGRGVVTYYIHDPTIMFSTLVEQVIRDRPGLSEEVYATGPPEFRVYRLNLRRPGPAGF